MVREGRRTTTTDMAKAVEVVAMDSPMPWAAVSNLFIWVMVVVMAVATEHVGEAGMETASGAVVAVRPEMEGAVVAGLEAMAAAIPAAICWEQWRAAWGWKYQTMLW